MQGGTSGTCNAARLGRFLQFVNLIPHRSVCPLRGVLSDITVFSGVNWEHKDLSKPL